MSLFTIQGAFELGCIFTILGLGLFISFKILNIPDLTVDGSFTCGCAASAVLAVMGHPFLGILAALFVGGLAGIVTGFLQTKLKVQSILAGILTMTALYSINLRIMGNAPSISLFNIPSIFSAFDKFLPTAITKTILLPILVFLIIALLTFFLKTQLGLSLRATGDNEIMVRASSINTDAMKILGLALANALVAMAGGIFAQHQSFADISSGIGMMVIALASIIIGETLLKGSSIIRQLISVMIGAIIYRYLWAFALQFGVNPNDLKLLSALLVALAISLPTLKQLFKKKIKRGAHHA